MKLAVFMSILKAFVILYYNQVIVCLILSCICLYDVHYKEVF